MKDILEKKESKKLIERETLGREQNKRKLRKTKAELVNRKVSIQARERERESGSRRDERAKPTGRITDRELQRVSRAVALVSTSHSRAPDQYLHHEAVSKLQMEQL